MYTSYMKPHLTFPQKLHLSQIDVCLNHILEIISPYQFFHWVFWNVQFSLLYIQFLLLNYLLFWNNFLQSEKRYFLELTHSLSKLYFKLCLKRYHISYYVKHRICLWFLINVLVLVMKQLNIDTIKLSKKTKTIQYF